MVKINRLSPDEAEFTQLLPVIDSSIKCLYFIGSLPPARTSTISIVGSRKPTTYVKEMAYKLSYDLAKEGVTIISGLALGIDAIAHKGALDAGGTTIAVLANGLDSIHPASNRDIALQIIQKGGAIISEYPEGTPPFREHFIARNRIVSGLSDALIVVEAAQKSGTLHTAGFALEQGKLVCAVPGNVTSFASTGCNNLIKKGASLITSAEDVLEELGVSKVRVQKRIVFGDTPAEEAILSLLRDGERDGITLQQKSGLTASEYSQTLTILEIKGQVRALGANQWANT